MPSKSFAKWQLLSPKAVGISPPQTLKCKCFTSGAPRDSDCLIGESVCTEWVIQNKHSPLTMTHSDQAKGLKNGVVVSFALDQTTVHGGILFEQRNVLSLTEVDLDCKECNKPQRDIPREIGFVANFGSKWARATTMRLGNLLVITAGWTPACIDPISESKMGQVRGLAL